MRRSPHGLFAYGTRSHTADVQRLVLLAIAALAAAACVVLAVARMLDAAPSLGARRRMAPDESDSEYHLLVVRHTSPASSAAAAAEYRTTTVHVRTRSDEPALVSIDVSTPVADDLRARKPLPRPAVTGPRMARTAFVRKRIVDGECSSQPLLFDADERVDGSVYSITGHHLCCMLGMTRLACSLPCTIGQCGGGGSGDGSELCVDVCGSASFFGEGVECLLTFVATPRQTAAASAAQQ